MATSWPLKVEVDVVEPRPQKGRLMVAADGTTWDMVNSSNVWLDPATLTLMLAPLPVTSAWRTTYTGNYARYQKTDYTLITSAKWANTQVRASGDYFLQSLDVTERVETTTSLSANQPMVVCQYVPDLKGLDNSVILKAGWNVGNTGSVEVWLSGNGTAQVYKSGVLVGQYDRNDTNQAPGVGAPATVSNNGQFITMMMIPFRRRELLVVTDFGLSFSHVFADLDPLVATHTIVPAGKFSWIVPSGQATVQLAKVFFAGSGYALSPVKKLRYAPPSGATFTTTFARDTIGQTGSLTMTTSVVKTDGTAYTPNGVIDQVRLKVSLGGINTGSYGVYEVDQVYDPAPSSTYNGTVDITCDIESLSLSVNEDGRTTVDLAARRGELVSSGVQQPGQTSDRPIRIAVGDGAVTPTWIDVFRGSLTSPQIEYAQGDTTLKRALYRYSGQDRSRDFDLAYMVESFPYDGLAIDVVIADLMEVAGYSYATDASVDSSAFVVPYSTNISKGQYALTPDYGDTVGGLLDKLQTEYFATWVKGWMPTTSGYKYIWRDVNNAATTPVVTLYQSYANALTAGVPTSLAGKRVVRRMSLNYETPEATSVTVKGMDPATGLLLTRTYIDTAAETSGTAPASRPLNWRGRPCLYELRDPALTTQAAVDASALVLYNRLTTGRTLVEWESDFLVLSTNNRPLWLTDVVRIMDTDGTTVKGDFRIIAIPTIEFQFEPSGGAYHVRRATYRGVKV